MDFRLFSTSILEKFLKNFVTARKISLDDFLPQFLQKFSRISLWPELYLCVIITNRWSHHFYTRCIPNVFDLLWYLRSRTFQRPLRSMCVNELPRYFWDIPCKFHKVNILSTRFKVSCLFIFNIFIVIKELLLLWQLISLSLTIFAFVRKYFRPFQHRTNYIHFFFTFVR